MKTIEAFREFLKFLLVSGMLKNITSEAGPFRDESYKYETIITAIINNTVNELQKNLKLIANNINIIK